MGRQRMGFSSGRRDNLKLAKSGDASAERRPQKELVQLVPPRIEGEDLQMKSEPSVHLRPIL